MSVDMSVALIRRLKAPANCFNFHRTLAPSTLLALNVAAKFRRSRLLMGDANA